jgi:DNA-binding HxlR family transcriptional regulator
MACTNCLNTVVDSDEHREEVGPPTLKEFDESEIERIVSYLNKKGGVRVLEELQSGPKRFVTLEETLNISKATITDRITDAREVGLISETPDYGGGNGYKRHPLTAKGQVVADELERTDLARIRKEIRKLEAEFDEQLSEFETSMDQKTAELNDALVQKLEF